MNTRTKIALSALTGLLLFASPSYAFDGRDHGGFRHEGFRHEGFRHEHEWRGHERFGHGWGYGRERGWGERREEYRHARFDRMNDQYGNQYNGRNDALSNNPLYSAFFPG